MIGLEITNLGDHGKCLDIQRIVGLPEAEYHASTGLGSDQWISRSMIHCYHQSPGLFRDRYVLRLEAAQVKRSEEMRFGTLFEAHLLGDFGSITKIPDTYISEAAKTVGQVLPWNSRTKPCIQWMNDREDATIEKPEDLPIISIMKDSLGDYIAGRGFRAMIETADQQVVYRWIDVDTGLLIQTRVDLEWADAGLMNDVKTSAKHPDKFYWAAKDWGYQFQAALYTRPVRHSNFEFSVFQKSGARESDILTLPDRWVEHVDRQIDIALAGIKARSWSRAFDSGKPTEISLPFAMEEEIDGSVTQDDCDIETHQPDEEF